MSESVSDDRQTRLTSWLEEKRPDLASMYRSARDLLATAAKPGDERTRVSHISHSMRPGPASASESVRRGVGEMEVVAQETLDVLPDGANVIFQGPFSATQSRAPQGPA